MSKPTFDAMVQTNASDLTSCDDRSRKQNFNLTFVCQSPKPSPMGLHNLKGDHS